ncbi:D-3-phosphoglycerate dehydrogenase [hydrothermal vent metagenome]|uniref:D-3-phosphoglycerate dehydrogenase n=1 Tax=hydrothermal vent metagenome TaxID=652676 RepID=A0A3B1E958_9ZZZZ
MKVLIADKFEQVGLDGLAALGCEVVFEPGLGAEDLSGAFAAHDPEVLIVRSTKVHAPAIEGAGLLKLIIRAGSGYDNIDGEAAAARGIGVCNCPGMNAVAVAELTMGLLLSCDRRIPDQTADLRAGKWNKKEYSKARGLKGRVLGVVGLGNIGYELVKRARAFDMTVHSWSRDFTPDRARTIGVEWWGSGRAELLTMASRCDAVSVHVALTPETKGLFDREFFTYLKPGAYFINTSRGGVVDEEALAEAVRTKGIRCGLDVWADQPTPTDTVFADALIKVPGVIGTHHCGASTDQAQAAVAEEAVRIVRVYKDTGHFENRVNTPHGEGGKGGAVPAALPVSTITETPC